MDDRASRPPRPDYYLGADGRRVPVPRRPSWLRRLLIWGLTLGIIGGIALAIGVCVFLWQAQRTPREWAPYLERRAEGHRASLVDLTGMLADWLVAADRMTLSPAAKLPANLGAAVGRSGLTPPGRLVPVESLPALQSAIATARPGDVIELMPGHYRFSGRAIKVTQAGTAQAPITVRAGRLGDASIESDALVMFNVEAPFWHFENLSIRGICGDHTYCEHAFHVVGAATDTLFRNNQLEDFNAAIKINGEGGHFPDRGLIDGNSLTETAPRDTGNPITPIDLVAADGWMIRNNFIADFVRKGGGAATYGAFVKGEGEHNVFERNLVICEWKLRGAPGPHVGLSLGGGGTDMPLRRQQGRTGFEQIGGAIRDNLIVACSDDGIYLNRSAQSVVDHNTLIDTAGIDAHFIETSATVTANIVDGAIRARNGATLRGWDNQAPFLLGLFIGWHPERSDFTDPARLDLTWRRAPDPVPDTDKRADLCGAQRQDPSRPGAFEDFTPCLTAQ